MTPHFLLNFTPYLSLSSQGTTGTISELQDWSTTRRELSKSDMAHDATWLLRQYCNLDVFFVGSCNAVSVQQFEVWNCRVVLACLVSCFMFVLVSLAQGFLRYRGAEGPWTFANS